MASSGFKRLLPFLASSIPYVAAVNMAHRARQLVLSETSPADAPALRSWPEARSLAEQTVKQMNQAEHFELLRGAHFRIAISPEPGYYVGNTPAVPRLGIPALKMQDAGQGFRDTEVGTEGTTTCWPSLLAFGATWDEALVEQVAGAIGEEFRGKGANVLLGPSINVHRSAAGGRNFEYMSGEDPYLGARLTRAYVRGVQSQGVMAVAKHWVMNEQETNRMLENSIVDDRTAWELYYPPFEAAVDAGVGSFMCSYNRVNGNYSCANSKLLLKDLKGTMNFQGFVMSDWAATHSPANLLAGLDQEQPGIIYALGFPIGMEQFTDVGLKVDGATAVKEATTRVLTSIYHLGLDKDPGCAPPGCMALLKSNQKTAEHQALAREAAAASVVLLKNKDGFLPIKSDTVRTLAVVGEGFGGPLVDAMFYAGGGSGFVFPGMNMLTPLDAIKQHAAAAGIQVVQAGTNQTLALQVAKAADAVVVIGGAKASEGADRTTLSLDDGVDGLIAAVAAIKPTVVLLEVPGAVLTPWRDQVTSIAALLMGGEGTGSAWASTIFGEVNPTGKLPVMFPATDKDLVWPSSAVDVPYCEGLLTSYRSPVFKAAFPFGHGLSYSSFEYGAAAVLEPEECQPSLVGAAYVACVGFTVTNTGKVPGAEVAQAYAHFPNQHLAGTELAKTSPDMVMRGFVKTRKLAPNERQRVTFGFTARDLSRYDPATGGWILEEKAEVRIGSSSADIRQVVQIGPFIAE